MKLEVEYVDIDTLKPYKNNAKVHTDKQIEQIKLSIEEFGMNDPIAIWKNNEIIEGHGRLMACQQLGFDKIPVIRLDHLNDEQRRAYSLVHNKLTMETGFDIELLNSELSKLSDFEKYGFVFDARKVAEEVKQQQNFKRICCPRCGKEIVRG